MSSSGIAASTPGKAEDVVIPTPTSIGDDLSVGFHPSESTGVLPHSEGREGFFDYREEKTMHVPNLFPGAVHPSEPRSRAPSFVAQPPMPVPSLSPTLPPIPDESHLPAKAWIQGHAVFDEPNEVFVESDIAKQSHPPLTPELREMYKSFLKCVDIRDRYMKASLQRLGDNPKDYDGTFKGFTEDICGVSGVKKDTDLKDVHPAEECTHEPWEVYPHPPPPHWHWMPDSGPAPLDPEGKKLPYAHGDDFDGAHMKTPGAHPWGFEVDERGVFQVYEDVQAEAKKPLFDVPTIREYFMDLEYILGVIGDGPTKSFAFRRLKYLASKFTLYSLLNEYQEISEMKRVPHRDFYNVRKVDTHVHHSSSMNQKHLLRFIKSKMKRSPHDKVIFRDGKELTLEEVFQSLNLTAYDLSIDTLDMHAHQDSFHRFDKFNLKYNPIGESRLREIFLKTDNFIEGRYLAELTRELMKDLEQSKYQNCEWRLSIYGRSLNEWDKLAKWVVNNKLFSHNVRWLIQVPRLYNVYRQSNQIENFAQLIRNVFLPLFEVTKDPSSHPELHVFLQRVVGFDTVDDESKAERRTYKKFPLPHHWNDTQNPPYSYCEPKDLLYVRQYVDSKRMAAEKRLHGEAGDPDHLTSAFITSHSISHGILLRKVPALQYLFYIKQIGLAMSPLSNNALFLTYERNPITDFFKTGLNVSLSTDDPLQFHFTKEPLLEEYSVAAHIYKFPQSSLAELARNSVIQSGFEMELKRHWLGQKWYLPGAAGNDIHQTNVPNSRLHYRHQTLLEELAMLRGNDNPIPNGQGDAGVADPIPFNSLKIIS
ncbi:AMP deaminase [Tulasnella sp. 403]|nr:AMP deaminase [Tulasnella sp. 403]